MTEFNFFFGIIPEAAYKYILMSLLALIFLRDKIPIINKIDIKIRLPDEFMRHFRWITPLMILGLWVWAAVIYAALRTIIVKLNAGG